MSGAVDTSRALELGGAALALERKGHFARSAAKYAAAVAAAQELAQPDCLVVAMLQLMCVNTLTCVASAPTASPAERTAAVQQLFAHQDAALETLRRRLAAGALLGGRCRPYEVAWYDGDTSQLTKEGKAPSSAGKAEWATLVGFDALLRGANNILQEVVHTSSSTGAREQQRCSLVVAALDAITARADEDAVLVAAAQRRRTLLWTSNQTTLVTSFREVVSRGQLQTDTPNGAALAAAWARLQATGVLAIAGTDAHAASGARMAATRGAASSAAAAAAACRTCALSGCGARELHAAQYKSCGACRSVVYCCKEHQLADWPSHKAACKAARKAAA